MALQQWAIPQLSKLLPLDQAELEEVVRYTSTLPPAEAGQHLRGLLGDNPEALSFISEYNERRSDMSAGDSKLAADAASTAGAQNGTTSSSAHVDEKAGLRSIDQGSKTGTFAPPAGPPPGYTDEKAAVGPSTQGTSSAGFAPPSVPPPTGGASRAATRHHTNPVIEAGKLRARDEQEMQQLLQNVQYQYGIYNDIEPEHECEYACSCAIHQYQDRKYRRLPVQEAWSKAVMYPGEKSYHDNPRPMSFGASMGYNSFSGGIFGNNPYRFGVISPYGYRNSNLYGPQKPQPSYHAQSIHQTIQLNNQLNRDAQTKIDAKEPSHSIWIDDPLTHALADMKLNPVGPDSKSSPVANYTSQNGDAGGEQPKKSKMASFRKAVGMKTAEEKQVSKVNKMVESGKTWREQIEREEMGRWPDQQWRDIVANYQEKVGMTRIIANLREKKPIEYLHLLRAGYFEPIPVAWAVQNSNPLKFTIDAAAGWRGITPGWRGYEDTAEERLYWVLNHREGSVGQRLKPDFISEMNMARARMAKAVPPPPEYSSSNDVCHVQHTTKDPKGYSNQVMPAPFRAFDRPEQKNDDTMILLDVSGSMDFDPVRPLYNQYLIVGYDRSTQPKNKDVAKAIIRRFTDAMSNHDHSFSGYDLVTFSNAAKFIGTITHKNLDEKWKDVRISGGTRVMTGWQMVKERHFQKHAASATHHPVYGWQAGPETPMLRLLLLLDGEAIDMDELELDLLGLSWAHVTIFLIGVDGCPHHHRHANELQRISDVNHHVSFVDAQGNTPERFVTHELLKRHLGYDLSMQEFQELEELPAYTE